MITKKQRKQIKENRRQNIKDFFKYFIDEEFIANAFMCAILIAICVGVFSIVRARADKAKEMSKPENTEVVIDTMINGSHIIVKTRKKDEEHVKKNLDKVALWDSIR